MSGGSQFQVNASTRALDSSHKVPCLYHVVDGDIYTLSSGINFPNLHISRKQPSPLDMAQRTRVCWLRSSPMHIIRTKLHIIQHSQLKTDSESTVLALMRYRHHIGIRLSSPQHINITSRPSSPGLIYPVLFNAFPASSSRYSP